MTCWTHFKYCGRMEALGTVVASWEKIARKTRNLESGMCLTWVVQHLWNATRRNYQKRFPNRDGENCWSCSRLQLILSWVTISQKNNRRKFRNFRQCEQMKSKDGKSQREEKSRREKIREEKESEERRSSRAKKVGKSRNTVFFEWFVVPEGRKVGSLKRWVRSHLARWEMKNCTPLWREAHFEVKMYKAPQLRTLLRVAMWKKCTPLWREAHFEVKMYKAHQVWTTFGSWDVEKVHAVVARSTFRSQNVKSTRCSDHFWTFRCRFAWQAQGIVHLLKSEQNVRVL